MGGLSFGQDSNGNWGYKIGGTDTVTPFSHVYTDKIPIQQGGFEIAVDFQPQFIAVHADNVSNKILGYTGWAMKNGISSGVTASGSTIKLSVVFEGNKITANPPINPKESGYNYDVVIF